MCPPRWVLAFPVALYFVILSRLPTLLRLDSLDGAYSLGDEPPSPASSEITSLAMTATEPTTSIEFLKMTEIEPAKDVTTDAHAPPIQIMLLRAIGNPLPPRHHPEQAYHNLKFTLENELEFPGLNKWWVLNRLVNETHLQRLESLLQSHRQKFFVIPFNLTDYAKLKFRFDYIQPNMADDESDRRLLLRAPLHDKALYFTNQNAARNAMIEFGQSYSSSIDWILPWDGNCYLHRDAYRQLSRQLRKLPSSHKYAITMMNRVNKNKEVLAEEYNPDAIEEPQIIFHRTALGRFNQNLSYGRMNKVEFLQRLKVKGSWLTSRKPFKWEVHHLGPFYQPIPDLQNISADGRIKAVGYVTRLSSGKKFLELHATFRDMARYKSIDLMIAQLDTRVAVELRGFRPGQTVFYNEDAMERDRQLYRGGDANVRRIVDELHELAENAVNFGPWSVTDKPDDSVAVSGDKHDYFHLAPYFWPSSKEEDKDPNHKWHKRDGLRYPPTLLHGPGSENFDRTRLQEMQHNTTILGLAYFMTGKKHFAEVAARNIRTWFLNEETRMNPHLKFAQVQNGFDNNTGTPGGIIEFKDIYFMLDVIRIIEKGGFLSDSEQKDLRAWFTEYLDWLETSTSGMKISNFGNNQGVYYSIQVLAIASFIQDTAKMVWHAERSTAYLFEQIEEDGSMPREVKRPICEHYQFFALQGWSILSRIAETATPSMWAVQVGTRDAQDAIQLSPLCRAARFAIPFFGRTSKCKNSIDAVENGVRWWPLLQEAQCNCPLLRGQDLQWPIPWFERDAPRPPGSPYEMPNLFHPHDGIAPFWSLGLVHGNLTFLFNTSSRL